MVPPPARTIAAYALVEVLRRGSSYLVYRAVDPALGRRVALKLARASSRSRAHHRRASARLRREARVLARIRDPSVPTVYELGEWQARPFLAMELMEGSGLDLWLHRPRGLGDVLSVFRQAARALHAIHRAGFVHRSVKPANLRVDCQGRVRLAEVDRAIARGDPDPAWRRSGPRDAVRDAMGAPVYMAPEQQRREPLDERSDVYALSAVLFEALTHSPPFRASTLDRLLAAKEAGLAPATARALPRRVRWIVQRGLAPDRRHRFTSAASFEHALTSLLPPRQTRTRTRGAEREIKCDR